MRRWAWVAVAVGLSLGAQARPAGANIWPGAAERIAAALTSSEASIRRQGASQLLELPPDLARELTAKALGDTDAEVRLRAAQAAAQLRLPKGGDLVVSWLSETDSRLRLAACDVVRVSPTERAVVALGRVLGDPEQRVRVAAAAAMGASGSADAVSPLLGHLDDPAPEVRIEVARALGRIGDGRAAVPLVGRVQDSAADVRRAVARALGELGDRRAVGALVLALQDAASDVRVEAVTALGRLQADEATPSVAALVEAEPEAPSAVAGRGAPASTGGTEVRIAAIRALGRIGTPAALRALVVALAREEPSSPRPEVRSALIATGRAAVDVLTQALTGAPPTRTAAGAALALGAIARDAGDAELSRRAGAAVVRAMQRGVVPLRSGLGALAAAGDPGALPTVLELVGDDDVLVRREAMKTAAALLDPKSPDGRAVEPVTAVLRDPATPNDERIELLRVLGRTGAARAAPTILTFVGAKPKALSVAAIGAIGSLAEGGAVAGDKAIDDALVAALDDESGDVRLAAALALGRLARSATTIVLLERLLVAAEQDRGALALALSDALARSTDPAHVRRAVAALATAPEAARDALIEGLGRMRTPTAAVELGRLVTGGIDDRRKVAEALSGHAAAPPVLRRLAADPDAGVRANATWSLGAVGGKADLPVLASLLSDPDVAVVGNAAAALGRVGARTSDSAAVAPLCRALGDGRPYVRVNALGALTMLRGRCDALDVVDVLVRDASAAVRVAAADYLRDDLAAVADSQDARTPIVRRALARCASEDRDASVAARCASAPRAAAKGTDDVAVLVVPEGADAALPRAPFALVRPDGLFRLGIADRRGQIFEAAVPRGTLRLAVPAALAR